MSSDQVCAERAEFEEGERRIRLAEARDLLTAALELLDQHSRSPAPANVDMAIYHIAAELDG